MIIDFHTHTFPDKIAQKTIDYLSAKGNIPPFSDGSVAGLVERMIDAEVDVAVNLPVVTNPSQFESVNRFAMGINESFEGKSRRIVSFAGIHPACDDIKGKMRWIKDQGFIGVKIHPDYQETYFDDEGYISIISAAKELDLIVTTHAGVDVGYPDSSIKCTPDRARKVIRRVGHSKLVLAHMGGSEMSDDVCNILCGEDVYFDTAYVLRFLSKETIMRIIDRHGEDKILFASDSPWSSIKGDVEIIKSLGLNRATEDKIFFKNAEKLLGI